MELPHKPPYQAIDRPFTDSAFQLLFDEKPVRGYRMTLGGMATDHLRSRKAPVVVICVDDGADVKVGGAQLHKKGDYVFIPAGSKLDFQNAGQADAKLAVFELK
jgi:glyoxylate utilization-related uncharacterized protein